MALAKEYKLFLEEQTHLKESTIKQMSWVFANFPKPEKLTAEFFKKQIKKKSPWTLRTDVWNAKTFLKWYLSKAKTKKDRVLIQKQIDDITSLKLPKRGESVTVKDLYTRDELSKIFSSAHHTRDRALLEVLYESAFRAGELLSMTFEGVEFPDENTAQVTVTGKTGTRQIPIFRSVPALKTWMNVHPSGKGPIWAKLQGRHEALGRYGLRTIVKKAIKGAKLGRKCKKIIHMFRHTRATELVKLGVRGQTLNKFMGWTKRSHMEEVYVHLSTHDVENEIRSKVFGIEPSEAKAEPLMSSTICPRCETNNEQEARFCLNCNMPLSNEAIVELVSKQEDRASLETRIDSLENLIKQFWYETQTPSTGKVIEFKDGKLQFVPEDEGGGPVRDE